jgi:hypothetical protein
VLEGSRRRKNLGIHKIDRDLEAQKTSLVYSENTPMINASMIEL